MTLPELETALKTVCPDVYELAAPPGLSQYVVYQAYGFETVFGDDCNMVDAPKVQIDIQFCFYGGLAFADKICRFRGQRPAHCAY